MSPRKISKTERAIVSAEQQIAAAAWALEQEEMVIVKRILVAITGPGITVKIKAVEDQFDPQHRAKCLDKLHQVVLAATGRWYARYRVGAYLLDFRWVNSQLTRTSYAWPPQSLPDGFSRLAFQGRAVIDDVENSDLTTMENLVAMAEALLSETEEWYP